MTTLPVPKHTLYITEEIKKLQALVSDLEWEGKECRILKEKLKSLKLKQEQGILYEPLF